MITLVSRDPDIAELSLFRPHVGLWSRNNRVSAVCLPSDSRKHTKDTGYGRERILRDKIAENNANPGLRDVFLRVDVGNFP